MNFSNNIKRHKTFISFRNPEAAKYKEKLLKLNEKFNIFDDYSIGKGDIIRSEFKTDEDIRKEIVNEWISGATVTILLVNKNMSESKFIDWEMQATMSDNINNPKMGLVCIFLPDAKNVKNLNATNVSNYSNLVMEIVGGEGWKNINKDNIDNEYSDLPDRVRKNLKRDNVWLDIISWDELFNKGEEEASIFIKKLLDKAFEQREKNKYDASDRLQRTHR